MSGSRVVIGLCVLLIGILFGPLALSAEKGPVGDGLVLWLDALDATTLTTDPAGRISDWSDKSESAHHARQSESDNRPLYSPGTLGAQAAVRFDGNAFLNLGQPNSLDFAPGDPYTAVVVYRVSGKNCGTFLAKGGGEARQRAYQCYLAPGRLGAISYGVMRENQLDPGANVAIYRCDGSRVDVSLGGRPSFSFNAGQGSSDVDVLIGARRKNADNTGIFYALRGDLSEILVYNRALGEEELAATGSYLKKRHSLGSAYVAADDVKELVARLVDSPAPPLGDGTVEVLARFEAQAAGELRSALAKVPAASLPVAELLLRLAEKNKLGDDLAVLAGELLHNHDPFVRGMAQWAISMKVGGENNGQQSVWPRTESPQWYENWRELSFGALLEADWVRQAVSLGLHGDQGKLLASVDAMIERAEGMSVDFRRSAANANENAADVEREVGELRAVRGKLAGPAAGEPVILPDVQRAWLDARRVMRRIVLANPAVDFENIVFVRQFAPHTVRNITRSYAWKHKPGGDISILSDLESDSTAKVRHLLAGRLGPGYVWGLDLAWDADRVVFAYAKQPNWPPAVNTADYKIEGTNVFELRKHHQPLHIFEATLDGSKITQLTDDPYWSDFEPTYCADGRVVFASDRCGRAAECGNDAYDHTNPNLYVMRPDGTQVRQLTDSKDIDRYPHSLDDGRIAYTHWEYQERHFMEVHALWTIRPDGSMSDALYKHHMRAPCGLRDTRSVPSSSKLVAVATGHHTFAYGPVVVVDPRHGMNNEAGLRVVTPGVAPQEGPMAGTPVPQGGVLDQGGLYQTPWALDENCFLAAYSYARPGCTAPAGADSNGFGLYVIDSYGNRELLYRDPVYSCSFPVPLKTRRRPPMVPDVVEESADSYATCYVTNVYDGMAGVPRGTVKYIRVAQHVGWPFDEEHGQMDYIPGVAGQENPAFQSWSPGRVIGDVPVAADGSACFKVPADTAVYFQALDENRMEVYRMRSMVSLKAGEVRGCRGCHESQAKSPIAAGSIPVALRKPAELPTPPPWGADRLLGYEWLVQPILDRHCVDCHGQEDPEGKLDFTSTRSADGLMQSYRTMFGLAPGSTTRGRLLVSCSDRFSNADVTRPMQFGSHKSPLIRVLLDDQLHRDEVHLDAASWRSLVTWVDANAPYHDRFLNKRPSNTQLTKQGGVPRLTLPREFQGDLAGSSERPK